MADVPRTIEAEMNLDKGYDASDASSVNDKRTKAGRAEREKLEVLQAMMEQPQIRKYFWQWLESLHIFGNPFIQGDSHATAFNLGKQDAGKRLLMDIMNFPELYVLMVNESKGYK